MTTLEILQKDVVDRLHRLELLHSRHLMLSNVVGTEDFWRAVLEALERVPVRS